MKRKLVFRQATIEDTCTIVELGTDISKPAFGPYHKPEDIAEYFESNFNDELIQSLIEEVSSHVLLGYEGEIVID